MDDIYDDLDNYNDLAELQELKKENQELKFKLADCDSRIEKLQEDFDKVSMEFRNLEINYSSLLKTAKAEIERKTQLISSLNVEKDNIVLNSLQNSNNNFTNMRRVLSRSRLDSVKKGNDSDSVNSSKKSLLLPDTRNRSIDRNRNDENRYPSVETASSLATDDTSKFANKTESLGAYKNPEVSKPMSIKDRRKSMPVVSQEKFCSDEDNNSPDQYDRSRSTREDKRGLIPNRLLNEQSRDTYHDRYNRFDRYRGDRGRGRKPQRYKRNFSPDKHRRLEDERHDKRRSRFDSPPLDRSDHRNRNRRSNYERDNFDDRHKPRQENYTFKHKIHGEYEEPTTKRARLESNPYGDDDSRTRRTPEFIEERPSSRNLQHLQHETCQSPDYSNPELVSPHPVREIKDNAATSPNQDPRLLSKKYVKKSEGGKIVLTTCTGRNVDLIPVQQYTWMQNETEIPKALQERPSIAGELIKDLYTDIEYPVSNMSFESGEIFSETNDTATPDSFYGSDEVDRRNECGPNETLTPHIGNADNIDMLYHTTSADDMTEPRSLKHNPITSIDNVTEHGIIRDNQPTIIKNTTKYSIPKVKPIDKTTSCLVDKNPLALLMKEIRDDPGVVNFTDPIPKSKSLPSGKHTKLDVDTVFSRRQAEKKRKEKLSKKHIHQIREFRSSREIVAGDLELSDENSDNIDIHNRIVADKSESQEICVDKVNKNSNHRTKEIKQVIKIKEIIDPKKSLPELIETDINTGKIVQEHTDIDTDSKNKSKKKSHKKTAAKDSKEEVTDKISKCEEKVVEKKSKSKEKSVEKTSKSTENLSKKICVSNKERTENSKLKEEKNSQKLYDLFGDSSSLITPEDLGLVPVDSVPYTNNLPLFEDAQHATDGAWATQPNKTTADPYIKQNIESNELSKFKKNTADNETKITTKFINLNPCIDDDEGVVSTQVISSGVQSQVPSTHITIPDCTETIEVHKKLDVLKNQPVPIALATSTPHKNLLNIHNEVETQSVDSSCGVVVSVRSEVQNDTSSQSSISNGLDSGKVPDTPDVRLIIKNRRKKLIKKS